MVANRRRHYLINRPLQLRFMLYITVPLLAITSIIMFAAYVGVWGNVLDSFSDEKFRNDLIFASRLTEYEQARSRQPEPPSASLAIFKSSEKLSARQREVFKDILNHTNKEMFPKFLAILIFLAWGSIFVSHKIAGPFYRFSQTLEEMGEGNFRTRIHLRKGDEGRRTLGDRFNKTLLFIDKTFSKLKHIIRENENNPPVMTQQLKDELSKIKTSADT